jgi:ABC-2 type transport system permease protein
MNLALWKKSLSESRWLLVCSLALMFAVHWLRVWIASFFTTSALESMFGFMPEMVEQLMPVSFSQVATVAGRIAAEYDDPVVLLLMTVWSISRGSDAISGELNRGTMEMLLGQPVTRLGVLVSQAGVTLGGAALLGLAAWLGTCTGLATVTLEQTTSADVFVPAALNLFALGAFLAGLTTMVSAATNYRSRTIGIVGGFYAISMIVKIVGRLVPGWKWVTYFSFFTAFEPQLLVASTTRAWSFWVQQPGGNYELGGLGYDGILMGLGLACYLVAAIIFCQRDLPAPL